MKKPDLNKYYELWLGRIRRTTLAALLRKITLPGFAGVPFSEVLKFFTRQLMRESISVRASASAYSFFLALFPGLIFLFTLVPYFPVKNLHTEVMDMMKGFMPGSAFETIQETLEDILVKRRGNLLSFGVVLTLYFSSNGINKLLVAFNRKLKRAWWKKYLVSIYLTLVLTILILVAVTIQIAGEFVIDYFQDSSFFSHGNLLVSAIWIFKLLITLVLSITAISILYFYGSDKKERYKFYSPGAFMSTIMIALVSYGFGYYVEHFGRYNKLYGSLGALIVLMIWLYFAAVSLISGYELNNSIFKAKKKITLNINLLK